MGVWIVFGVWILVCLALDLGVFNREAHKPSTREALVWTGIWITMSMCFTVLVYFTYEREWVANPEGLSPWSAVTRYLTGYLIEKSLSMDNIFVIALIFKYFRIPDKYQHKVLFWGVLGAIVFRGILIAIGVVLIQKFEWIMYVFAAILLFSAWRMWHAGDKPPSLERNPVLRFLRKFLPMSKQMQGGQFMFRRQGVTAFTPLFLALVIVETTDVMFAFDSIPAIFAITRDPFLVYTSNIFAILGLRALYFVLASLMNKFMYIKKALVFILFFVGVKIILSQFVELPEWFSLVVIVIALGVAMFLSLRKAKALPS